MTYAPTISPKHAELRQMLMVYLADQLIRASDRPAWYVENVPDGTRFVYLVNRFYHNREHESQTTEYDRYLCSRHWRILRLAVMVAANGRCNRCDGAATEVHHIVYERIGTELLTDLEPICCTCHGKIHGRN